MATKTKEPKDALALLKQDHEKVRDLLEDFEKAAGREDGDAERLLEEIESELKIHTTIEEEIFYPAFKEAASKKDDSKLYYEAVEEHHVVDLVLPEMEGEAGSPEFAAKAKVLKDLVEHHAEEEEKQMFPRAKKLMDKDELVSLGEQLMQRKKELQAENGGSADSEEDDEE
jgi:hemerythrin superfamily protein